MSINLKKNEKALLAAYNDVLSDKSDTDWAVFGYEGKSNDLKVVETGDGGLEEMVDELSGGKMMYAFLKVTDPNTQLPKNVLVNWSGEGVPSTRKGTCARHTTDVARFFRGAHVTINARSEMDLDEDTILDKVAKASGANFGFHKEKARPVPEVKPVGSVYQKANPRADINARSRDEFWEKQEKSEEQRRAAEKRSAIEARKKEELERREREAQEASQREKSVQERSRRIDEQKRREREEEKREREAREEALQSRLKQREQEVEAEREREKADRQRQRVKDHQAISSAVGAKKAGFEETAKGPEIPPKRPPKAAPVVPRQPEPEPEPEYEPEPEPEYQPEPEPEPEYPPEPEPEPEYPPEPIYEQEPEVEQPTYEDVPEPEQELYDDVQGGTSDAVYSEATHDDYYAEEPEQPMYDDVQGVPDEPEQPIYDEANPDEQGGGGGSGLRAKTVYDYEAEDDGELTFDVDEIITDIEQVDPGWWRGVRELDGSYGLFPANYVELID